MDIQLKYLIPSLLVVSSGSMAASYAVEARGDAMGGTGVVSANYLTAPFYNPAIVAIYRRNDDAGMLLPSFGLTYNDPDDISNTIDDVGDSIKNMEGGDSSQEAKLQSQLDALNGGELKADIGGAIAIGIPNQYISMNLFGKAYAETYVTPSIATTGSSTLDNAQNSTIDAVSVAVTEVGLSLAKYQTFLGQHISVGVSPKLQRVYTYVYEASLKNYDLSDIDANSTGETVFNLDAGLLWFYGPVRVGFAATNLVSRDITTRRVASSISGKADLQYSYQLRPLYTVGVGLIGDYASISVDYDLNEEERYTNFNDNTQMLRVGGEIDILRQLKLRAGYKKNLAYSNSDGVYTAGIGLSLLGLFELDAAVSYTNAHAKGAYVNFLSTY
ncbi:conjugal transfer protein TraF [Vibrio gazogenes]|uniref:Plasmid transfer operon, TraF, protein n=2 Tax=Vibrio gazogenes TaxID=687 RepID=A0A1M5C623_VIBGA|nr:conjugal transfer protein TraF [Vibrio gazogenes]USP15355.1 conjugal transfer protein TraF [Vibrio gazogenes]SHF50151.1 plasmid transfer operon, TraF, protein [Vibrio gazogenes DSM 21264] [Vibrio gazogenes DSM 21264 = NBRC 103151]